MYHIIKITTLIFYLTIFNFAYAQTDSTKLPLTFSGYLETYFLYDSGNPSNHIRPNFVYSHNRNNEVNINLGFVKANYQTANLRANLALAVGTFMNANYSSEQSTLKNIYEANAGIKISKKKNLWLDAGVFPSHIGFESAIGKDCWTLSRSILADNSPYFESGAKISFTTDNGKWIISGLYLNGWQRIQRVEGNNTLSFGHQIVYKPHSNLTLNSSSFVGNDKPDSLIQMRYFHNFYAIYQATAKIGFTAGFDMGAEQITKGSKQYNIWYSPVVIIRYATTSTSFLSARLEYYSDKNGVIIATSTPNGFQTLAYSLNYDHLIRENVMWRIEAKGYSSKDKTFLDKNTPTNSNFSLSTSLAISF
jgi:hypothetical protein